MVTCIPAYTPACVPAYAPLCAPSFAPSCASSCARHLHAKLHECPHSHLHDMCAQFGYRKCALTRESHRRCSAEHVASSMHDLGTNGCTHAIRISSEQTRESHFVLRRAGRSRRLPLEGVHARRRQKGISSGGRTGSCLGSCMYGSNIVDICLSTFDRIKLMHEFW